MLTYLGLLRGMSAADVAQRTTELLEVLELHDEDAKQVIGYSTGMRKKLGLAGGRFLRDRRRQPPHRDGVGPAGRPAPAVLRPTPSRARRPPTCPCCTGRCSPTTPANLCYVKDCARGIALLQLAEALNHRTYNVGSGRVTTNREVVVAAITRLMPSAVEDLPGGPGDPGAGHLNLGRIHEDTGYRRATTWTPTSPTISPGCDRDVDPTSGDGLTT